MSDDPRRVGPPQPPEKATVPPKTRQGPVPPPPIPTAPTVPLVTIDAVIENAPGPTSSRPPMPMPETSPLKMSAITRYGRYDILGRIAIGGMAEIFLARETTQVGTARLLAIKRILPQVAGEAEFVRMFLDEARLAVQLHHPSICHLYEFGELEGTYFIAMEWIYGAQLGKVIRAARAHGGVPPGIAARIIAQVADALHYAHRLRDANGTPLDIIHRDVSPHNVMVSYDGHVKLLDFGIAKASSHETKTEAGVVKGKFSYMSPQQCVGKPIDARADVFALGICLYELLTGQTLYVRDTEYATMKALIEEPVPSVRTLEPSLPPDLDAIVQKALQKKPDDRWKSAGAMFDALEDWIAKRGASVTVKDVAGLMSRLFEDQIRAGPLVDSTPFGQSVRKRAPSADDLPAVSAGTPGWGGIDGVEPKVAAPPHPAADGPPPAPIAPLPPLGLAPRALDLELEASASSPTVRDPDFGIERVELPEGGGSLDLAFDPHAPAARRPAQLHAPRPADAGRPVPRAAAHATARSGTRPAPGPPASGGGGVPRWVIGLAISVAIAAAGVGSRLLRSPSDAGSAPAAPDDDAIAAPLLAGATDYEAYVARPNASFFSADRERVRALVADLRAHGASRVLVADVVQMGSGPVAGALIVELPAAPEARRAIATDVALYGAEGAPITAEDVIEPTPGQRYVVVSTE